MKQMDLIGIMVDDILENSKTQAEALSTAFLILNTVQCIVNWTSGKSAYGDDKDKPK